MQWYPLPIFSMGFDCGNGLVVHGYHDKSMEKECVLWRALLLFFLFVGADLVHPSVEAGDGRVAPGGESL